MCTSPPSASVGNMSFEIVRGSFEAVLVDYFHYEPEMVIDAVAPARGPSEGGTKVIISGEHFSRRAADLGLLKCRFNVTDVVVAEYVSSKTIICITPMHATGAVAVEITSNLQQYTMSGVTYSFESVVISSVSPSTGPVRGGSLTLVTAITSPPLHHSLYCHFGSGSNGTTAASFDATGIIVCISPPAHESGQVHLSISSSTATYALSPVLYRYYEEPRLDVIYPVMGPQDGGTPLSIFGAAFQSTASVWCRFSSADHTSPATVHAVLVVAQWISTTHMECVTPKLNPGLKTLDITSNGQAPFSEDYVVFQSYPPILLAAILPPQGSVTGQTPVHIYGSGFLIRADTLSYLHCKFGNHSSRGVLLSATELVCLSPPGSLGFVTVEVTNNLRDYSLSSLLFEYIVVEPQFVLPGNGPISGGTVIMVHGTGFVSSPLYDSFCHFSALDAMVPAVILSSKELTCVTPSIAFATAQTIDLRLNLTGLLTSASIPFHFFKTPSIIGIHPMVGPVQGGTAVIVDGTSFSTGFWCRFGQAVVPSRRLTGERVQCIAPAADSAGHVEVAISSNNQNFETAQSSFEYVPNLQLETVYPRNGPTDGGTFVSVFGSFFHERSGSLFYLQCRFNTTAVPAIFISPSEVKCYTPEMPAGLVTVAVTNNLVDYFGGVYFEYSAVRLLRLEPSEGPASGGTRCDG